MSATPNRVRSIYMDCSQGDRFPARGDRISTGKTLYWVVMAHRVKRKDPSSCPRIAMGVITASDIEDILKSKLLRSALRRDSSHLFRLYWYPRKRKTQTFEEYMGATQ